MNRTQNHNEFLTEVFAATKKEIKDRFEKTGEPSHFEKVYAKLVDRKMKDDIYAPAYAGEAELLNAARKVKNPELVMDFAQRAIGHKFTLDKKNFLSDAEARIIF